VNLAALAAVAEPVVEYRTFHGVEVGIIHAPDVQGVPASWLVFPDGKFVPVRAGAYANFDEACAAEVAVWRIRRIRRGIDRPGVN